MERFGEKMKIFYRFSMLVVLLFSLIACAVNSPPTPSTTINTDNELAKKTLLDFLDDLSNGNFDQAALLYAGSYENMQSNNPDLDPGNHTGLLENACTQNGYQCLKVQSAELDQQTSESEFVFKVSFFNRDGTLLVLGPCCGANATQDPPRSIFYLKVVKTDKGKFVVMDLPPYQP
jgi:hypothetical protein